MKLLTLALAAAFIWPQWSFSDRAEDTLLYLVQQEHYRVCHRPIYQSWGLHQAANWRAKDMIVRNYFSHIILGTNKHAWDYYYRWDIHWYMAGEDIAWNSYPADIAAKGVFDAFMLSPSHRALIRYCGYHHIGVGDYQGIGPKKMFTIEVTN